MGHGGDEENTCGKYLMLIFMFISVVGLIIAFKKQIAAAIFSVLSKRVHARLIHQKNALFKQLQTEKIQKLKILEIGSGPGMNFKYYPDGTILTCLEPNPHHEKYLRDNLTKINPKIELKQFICGYAEDLSQFKDGEFDVVLETLVLCSVKSVEAVLLEIKRVLKSGGKFYFMDHVSDHGHGHGKHITHTSTYSTDHETNESPHGTPGTYLTRRSHTTHESHLTHSTHQTQADHGSDGTDKESSGWFFTLLHRVFHRLFHHNVSAVLRNREIAEAIEHAEFSEMETTAFKMQMPFLPWKSACIYGSATK